MAKLTRSNIAYNLEISPHEWTVDYEDESLTYVFSSELYMTKFFDKIEENRLKISHSLSKRFDFNIVNDKLCDIRLYSLIEKRGFLIKRKDEQFKCLSTLKLNGLIMTQEN